MSFLDSVTVATIEDIAVKSIAVRAVKSATPAMLLAAHMEQYLRDLIAYVPENGASVTSGGMIKGALSVAQEDYEQAAQAYGADITIKALPATDKRKARPASVKSVTAVLAADQGVVLDPDSGEPIAVLDVDHGVMTMRALTAGSDALIKNAEHRVVTRRNRLAYNHWLQWTRKPGNGVQQAESLIAKKFGSTLAGSELTLARQWITGFKTLADAENAYKAELRASKQESA